LGAVTRCSKDAGQHTSSGLWRRVGSMGSVICLALAHVGKGGIVRYDEIGASCDGKDEEP